MKGCRLATLDAGGAFGISHLNHKALSMNDMAHIETTVGLPSWPVFLPQTFETLVLLIATGLAMWLSFKDRKLVLLALGLGIQVGVRVVSMRHTTYSTAGVVFFSWLMLLSAVLIAAYLYALAMGHRVDGPARPVHPES